MTTPHAKTAEEVAKAIVSQYAVAPYSSGALYAAIAAAIRDEYERGLTIGFERGQGWAKTREGAMDRAGLVFDGEDKIVTRHGTILDDAGNVRRVRGELFQWHEEIDGGQEVEVVSGIALQNYEVGVPVFLRPFSAQGAKHE